MNFSVTITSFSPTCNCTLKKSVPDHSFIRDKNNSQFIKSLTAIDTQLAIPPRNARPRHGCFWRTRYENVCRSRHPVNPRKWYLTWFEHGLVQIYKRPSAMKNGTFSRSFWCARRTRSTFSFFLKIFFVSLKAPGAWPLPTRKSSICHNFFSNFFQKSISLTPSFS